MTEASRAVRSWDAGMRAALCATMLTGSGCSQAESSVVTLDAPQDSPDRHADASEKWREGQATSPDEDEEPLYLEEKTGVVEQAPLTIEWATPHDDPTSTVAIPFDAASPLVKLQNMTSDEIHVELHLLADNGSAQGTKRFAMDSIDLQPQAAAVLELVPAMTGFNLAEVRRSGQLNVAATPMAGDTAGPSAVTAPLYFHPTSLEPGTILVYGQSVLEDQFGYGDFLNERPDFVPPPGARVSRVTYAGPSDAPLPAPVETNDGDTEGADG